MPESKKMHIKDGNVKRTQEPTGGNSHWPNKGQFKQQEKINIEMDYSP